MRYGCTSSVSAKGIPQELQDLQVLQASQEVLNVSAVLKRMTNRLGIMSHLSKSSLRKFS